MPSPWKMQQAVLPPEFCHLGAGGSTRHCLPGPGTVSGATLSTAQSWGLTQLCRRLSPAGQPVHSLQSRFIIPDLPPRGPPLPESFEQGPACLAGSALLRAGLGVLLGGKGGQGWKLDYTTRLCFLSLCLGMRLYLVCCMSLLKSLFLSKFLFSHVLGNDTSHIRM